MRRALPLLGLVFVLAAAPTPTNPDAVRAAQHSPLVQSALASIRAGIGRITDARLRRETEDALTNVDTCVAHRQNLDSGAKRAIARELVDAKLIDGPLTDAIVAGIFPPLDADGTACPHLLQTFEVAPGGNGSHHDYPGGLPVHEAYNLRVALDLAKTNDAIYFARAGGGAAPKVDLDVLTAAVLWHDWAKALADVWNANGTITDEVTIAGTGSHHILGLAEAMTRQLPRAEILAQASAHAGPNRGQNDQIVKWIRAAAIIARKDPVAAGYLERASSGGLLLPTVSLAGVTSPDHDAFTATPEAVLTNLADANFYSVSATQQMEVVLPVLARDFGYTAGTAEYRNGFRNPLLSWTGADALAALFRDGGIAAVKAEADRALHDGAFRRR